MREEAVGQGPKIFGTLVANNKPENGSLTQMFLFWSVLSILSLNLMVFLFLPFILQSSGPK